jgi:hypothetical protein
MTGVHRDTIMRLGVRVGNGCAALMDAKMRDLPCTRLEMDYYNFVKRHNTLHCTPAMAAGVENDFWTVGDLLEAVA